MSNAVSIAQSGSNNVTMRNRIINGGMSISQRGTASVTQSGLQQYIVDRWNSFGSASSKFSSQQNAGSVTPPVGFTDYLGNTSLSAYTIGTGEAMRVTQYIEGYNIADLAWGTANAATVTLSFWVRSSLTGTFSGTIKNSASTRSYPFTYTISSANTWEKETVTIPGDTSGTWLTTNGIGIALNFSLGAGASISGTANTWAGADLYGATGAVSVVATNGATFYITGVQLEKGSTASPFEQRLYGTELSLCQRYYYKNFPNDNNGAPFGSGFNYSTTLTIYYLKFPVSMRASPTALEQSGTAAHYAIYNVGSYVTCTSVPSFNTGDPSGASYIFIATGLTAGQGSIGRSINVAAYLAWSAEL
jgi:hypothetical protein